MRNDLPEFIARIHEAGFLVKLDTNGYHPAMLRRLIEEGLLDYVAMDIKNSPQKYARTVGLQEIDLKRISECIALLMDGSIPYEFRTTVVRELHEACDFEEMGKWIEGADRYFLQVFTSRDTVPDPSLSAPDPAALLEFRDIAARYVKLAEVRGVD